MSAWKAKPGTCPDCHEPVLYVQMRRKDGTTGKKMRVDKPWTYSDGRMSLIIADDDGYGRVISKAPEGLRGRVSHYVSCKYTERVRAHQDANKTDKKKSQQGRLF